MEEREFHLTRLTALWPVIELLESPWRAQPALNRLITPDPYPTTGRPIFFLYTALQANFSWPHAAISHLRGRRWKPFPQVRRPSPWGINPPGIKQSVNQQPVNQPVILLGEWNALKHYHLRDKELPLRVFFIQAMPSFWILALYHCTNWLQTTALYSKSHCP